MEKFFVIGSEDPSFLNSERLTSRPGFQAVVVPRGTVIANKHLSPAYAAAASALKTVSLGDFILSVKKNPDIALVSCYDFPDGRLFVRKLHKALSHKFRLYDYYAFCLEHDVRIMFTPAKEERALILAATKEWAELRNHLTDEFSRFSLDRYLLAYRQIDTELLLPAYVGLENTYFNRLSRKLSLVPGPDEIYVDVGALDGDTVTAFVNAAGSYRAIHAFEPMARAFAELKHKTFYLNNFYPQQLAVSNKTGSLEFLLDDSLSFYGSRVIDMPSAGNGVVEQVPCAKLDDVLDDVTLLKIEVEGHECAVLEGAAHLIAKCKPDMAVQAYHLPLDPIRILNVVNAIHRYKHVAFRLHAVGMHIFTLYFSDRAPFA